LNNHITYLLRIFFLYDQANVVKYRLLRMVCGSLCASLSVSLSLRVCLCLCDQCVVG